MARVLEGVAIVVPEVGYCQGMNFIASALIAITDREEVGFWVFL